MHNSKSIKLALQQLDQLSLGSMQKTEYQNMGVQAGTSHSFDNNTIGDVTFKINPQTLTQPSNTNIMAQE